MIGKTISHYRIIEKLGEGGMGVVYKVEDTKLGRFAAIKVLPPHMSSDKEAVHRFVNEARAASALDHPNICTIYEIDETADGETFIAMAYYEGRTLRDLIESGEIKVEKALDITSQIAAGLAKAHERGIVHRDVKPSNVIVTVDGLVKILDFGLAKLGGRSRITRTGTTIGSVAYMAPEQARGQDVDQRADIFSLGIIMYELLSGHLPFRGEHEAAILYEIVHEDPTPLEEYREDVPEEVRHIVGTALEKDPADRQQSIGEIRERISQLAEISAVRRAIETGGFPGRRITGRGKGRGWTVPVAVTALIVSVFLLVRFWPAGISESPQEPTLAVIGFSDGTAGEDPGLSLGISDLVNVGLIANSPVRVISPEYLYELRGRLFGNSRGSIEADQALEVARKSGAAMFLAGRITRAGEKTYFTWRLVDVSSGQNITADRVEGADLAVVADRITAGVLMLLVESTGKAAPGTAAAVSRLTSESERAYRHYLAGVVASEEGLKKEAVSELERAIEIDSTFALAHFRLSREHFDYEAMLAIEHSATAWKYRERLSIKDRMRLEGWNEQLTGKVASALAIYRELIVRWPDDRLAYEDLARELYNYWYTGEAIEVCRQGLFYYPGNIKLLRTYWNSLGWSAQPQRAIDEALSFASRHPGDAGLLNYDDLGTWYLAVGKPDSAETAFRRALEKTPGSYYSLFHLSSCAYGRGEAGTAINVLEELHDSEDISPGQKLGVITRNSFWPSLAQLYAYGGQYEKAIELFEEARKEYIASGSYSGVQFGFDFNRLLLSMGRHVEVLAWAEEFEERTETESERYSFLYHKAKALAGLGTRLDEARIAVEELKGAEAKWGGFVTRWVLMVQAEIALAEQDPDEALRHLGELDNFTVGHGGWDNIEKRLLIARAHMMAGREETAAEVLEGLLLIHGGYAPVHFELGKVYEVLGRTGDAGAEYKAFIDAWRNADDGQPWVTEGRKRLNEM